jgi:hypothetical protein
MRDSTPTRASRSPSRGAIADAVGCSVLAFLFVPALAGLPGWIGYELANPLNFADPTVTLFLPVRGFRALLNAFDQGRNAGLLAGLLNGAIVCGGVWWRGVPAQLPQRLLLGGAAGATASLLMIATLLTINAVRAGELVIPFLPVAFEVASGLVCGVVAVTTMLRLLGPPATLSPAGDRAAARS